MKLLLLLWWGTAATYCSSSSAAIMSDLGVDGGDSCQIVGDEEDVGRQPSTVKKHGGKPGPKASSDGTGICFLCEEPGADIKFGPRNSPYFLHRGACISAKRCHDRQVTALTEESSATSTAKEKDKELLAKDPQAYKALVAPLLLVGNASRSQETLNQHRDKLSKTFFAETYVDKAIELVTKQRFKSFMKREEDYTDGEASSSFERRLGEQSSDNEASDGGGPQVGIRKNPVIGTRTGTIVNHTDKGRHDSNSSRNRDGKRRRDQDEARDCKRARNSSRCSDDRRGRGGDRADGVKRRSRSARRRERQAARDRTPTPPGGGKVHGLRYRMVCCRSGTTVVTLLLP